MMETIIRYIVIAIVLGVIGEVISHLSSSKTTDETISTTHYRVSTSSVEVCLHVTVHSRNDYVSCIWLFLSER